MNGDGSFFANLSDFIRMMEISANGIKDQMQWCHWGGEATLRKYRAAKKKLQEWGEEEAQTAAVSSSRQGWCELLTH